MKLVQGLKEQVLGVVRRGGREVAWTPEFMNLGNLLMLGKWAFEGRRLDIERRVRLHEKHVATLGLFPTLRRDLFVTEEEIRFTDKRVMPWSEQSSIRTTDDMEVLPDYVRDAVLPGSPFTQDPGGLDDALVVNIRRGDYYSVPEHKAEFGMDQVGYVREALRHVGDVPGRIIVISDGLDWCEDHLDGILSEVAPTTYEDGDLVHDLRMLVHARRLILPNSTFSYWGGYIGDQLHPGRQVIAPWFFSRGQDGRNLPAPVLPEWTALEGTFY